MKDILLQAKDDIRAVLSDTRPDLVSEFNATTGAADDPRWVAKFLSRHFPGEAWESVEIKDTADLLSRISKTIEQRAVAAVVVASRRNPHLFGSL